MGLMLDALKRLETRSAERQPADETPTDPLPLPEPAALPVQQPPIAATVESSFEQLEAAIAMATAPCVAEAMTSLETVVLPEPAVLPESRHFPSPSGRGQGEGMVLADEPLAALPSPRAQPKPVAAPAAPPRESVRRGPYERAAEEILGRLRSDRASSLLFTTAMGRQAQPGVLAHLGRTLAERSSLDIVLVDANLRGPRLADKFGIRAALALPEVLADEIDWRDVVRATATPRLCLLPGSVREPQSLAAGNTEALVRLVGELTDHYGLILVAGDGLTEYEAAAMAGFCDGTYLVAPLGQVTARQLHQAARAIRASGGQLLGCVAVEPSAGRS